MEGIRFTKEVVEKFIQANEGYKSSPRYLKLRNYEGTNTYEIRDGVVYQRQVSSTSWSDSHSDREYQLNIDEARNFFKTELERRDGHLTIPEL